MGGTPVSSVQFPAQLRDFHNKKAIASPKQSHGANLTQPRSSLTRNNLKTANYHHPQCYAR